MSKKNRFQVKSFNTDGECGKLHDGLGINRERDIELMSDVQRRFMERMGKNMGVSQDLEYFTENCKSVNEVALVAFAVGQNAERYKQMMRADVVQQLVETIKNKVQ